MDRSQAGYTQGPASCVRVQLPGGSEIFVRPLRYGERQPLLDVFDGMGARSRAWRFLSGVPRLTAPMLAALSAVDGHDHVAWLAYLGGRPVGIGRYVRLPEVPLAAEFALEVVDDQQGRGIGRVLTDILATIALCSGVRVVHATIAAENVASLRLVQQIGASGRPMAGVVEARGPLQPPTVSGVDRSTVLAVAAAARRSRVAASA